MPYIHYREIEYSYLQIRRLEAAQKCYERGFILCPPDKASERAEIAANLAQVYRMGSDQQEGEKWLNKAWLLAPKGSQIYDQLSRFVAKR